MPASQNKTCPLSLPYSPLNTGLRFSTKAASASRRSFVGMVASYALDSSGKATPPSRIVLVYLPCGLAGLVLVISPVA